jgi:hypothetical protein
VGEVSARLLAAGIPREERLEALSLLGLLLDHAGAGGRVRIPLEQMVGEFDVPVARAESALAALVRVGAVRRSDEGIVLVGRQPPPTGGLRLSAFLANVAAVLGEDEPEPRPASPARPTVLLTDSAPGSDGPTGSGRRRSRPRQPALAALALTAVVLLATLGPAGEGPTRVRTVGDLPATTAVPATARPRPSLPPNPWVSWPGPATRAEPGGERVAGEGAAAPPPGRPDTTVAGEDAGAGGRSGEGDPAAGVATAPDPAERRGAASGGQGAQGRSPARPSDPVPASPASPAPVVRCPAGAPTITVDSAEVRPAGLDVVPALGVPTTSVTEVRGRLRNATTATAVVRSFEVILGSGSSAVPVPGPPGPVTLAPGEQREWTVRTPATAEPETVPTVEGARIVDWGWQEPELARSCPH